MTSLDDRLQADLVLAMKDRDRARVTVLRTALAAIANAAAPPIDSVLSGATEHERLAFSTDDVRRIIEREIRDREDSIADYQSAGAGDVDAVSVLRREIDVLRTYVA